ncbi:DUF3040 domain-containing protein [Pseudonocardia nantongensis]|uniref:DUF3040 domain-containing protein n=1 Tax=Pseudonocardia nantongensis TaxID=1181885 RepID=UPI00397E4020
MFDDQDRHALAEIERRLTTEDPDFVARFVREQDRLATATAHRLGDRIALLVAGSSGSLLWFAGSPAGAVAAALTTGSVWLAWRFGDGLHHTPSM